MRCSEHLFPRSQALIRIIKPQVLDPQAFLQQHIQRNLEQLTKMLGRSADETIHVVHLTLCSLLKEQHPVFGQSKQRGQGLS